MPQIVVIVEIHKNTIPIQLSRFGRRYLEIQIETIEAVTVKIKKNHTVHNVDEFKKKYPEKAQHTTARNPYRQASMQILSLLYI